MATRDFPADVRSVRAVRSFIREAIPDSGGDVMMVASELATNVVRHAQTEFTVTVEVTDTIRLEVSDGSSIMPAVEDILEGEHTGGLGLRLVEDLTDRWGVETSESGKTVWVEMALTSPA